MIALSVSVSKLAQVEKIPSLVTAPREILFDIVDNNFCIADVHGLQKMYVVQIDSNTLRNLSARRG